MKVKNLLTVAVAIFGALGFAKVSHSGNTLNNVEAGYSDYSAIESEVFDGRYTIDDLQASVALEVEQIRASLIRG